MAETIVHRDSRPFYNEGLGDLIEGYMVMDDGSNEGTYKAIAIVLGLKRGGGPLYADEIAARLIEFSNRYPHTREISQSLLRALDIKTYLIDGGDPTMTIESYIPTSLQNKRVGTAGR